MKLILFLFPMILFAQVSGNPRRTGEAVGDYSIQAANPANPTVGKTSFYNKDGVFSQIDSSGNTQRIVQPAGNLLQNYDVEQGLVGFNAVVGTTVVNTATPLMGLKSLTFDSTALNDFVDTLPFLIKPGMQGMNCMGSFLISPTDGNLSASVINADGTTVVSQVIAASTINQTITLQFGCPLSTATVNERTLKVRIFQTTATNAAAVNLDSFWLGLFSADRIQVVEGSQWYYYTANADINGNFTFPAPTASTNDKTLFTYAGTTLTAVKPVNLSIFASAFPAASVPDTDTRQTITCNISGVSRVLTDTIIGLSANGGVFGAFPSAEILLSAGDTCTLFMDVNPGSFSSYTVNITATPLPSLASIVTSPNLPAGFYASKEWATTANCIWTTSTAGVSDFPLDAECDDNPRTFAGFAVADATLDGQLPQLTLLKMPKGIYLINVNSQLWGNGTQGTNGYNIRTSSGLQTAITSTRGSTGVTPSGYTISFTLNNPSDKTNEIIKISSYLGSAFPNLIEATPATGLSISVYYLPDLSSPYNQSIIAALPPQVSNSSEKSWRTESCWVGNNGTASIVTPDTCNNWVQSVVRTSAGQVTINIIPNIFSTPPQCSLSNAAAGAGNLAQLITSNPTTTQILMYSRQMDSGAFADIGFYLKCEGLAAP